MSDDRDHTIATATVTSEEKPAITLRMYAEHQSWPLASVDVELTYVVKDRNTR